MSDLVDTLLQAGFGELASRLKEIKPKDRTQQMILEYVANAVEREGVVSAQLLAENVARMFDGEDVELDLSDPLLASDMLAAMQELEIEQRSGARDLAARVSNALAPIVTGFLSALIRST